MSDLRDDYERDVRAILKWALLEIERGREIEDIAREAVQRRNELKLAHRELLPPIVRLRLEKRNLDKYGHPVGPDADTMRTHYGSWMSVIEAAARPANLKKSLLARRFDLRRR